jgi:anti-sigma factor RsiW
MRCEDVRPLLAEMAEGGPRAVGPVEVHLSSCPDCSAELRRYRAIVLELAALREQLIEPPPALLERLLADVPDAARRRILARVAADERVQHAALSVGGAVVGATAIGLLWWRAARRTVRV